MRSLSRLLIGRARPHYHVIVTWRIRVSRTFHFDILKQQQQILTTVKRCLKSWSDAAGSCAAHTLAAHKCKHQSQYCTQTAWAWLHSANEHNTIVNRTTRMQESKLFLGSFWSFFRLLKHSNFDYRKKMPKNLGQFPLGLVLPILLQRTNSNNRSIKRSLIIVDVCSSDGSDRALLCLTVHCTHRAAVSGHTHNDSGYTQQRSAPPPL